MNTFSIVLFIHVISAMALFVAIALEGAILARMRGAHNIEQFRQAVRGGRRLGAIYGPAFLGILLGGFTLRPNSTFVRHGFRWRSRQRCSSPSSAES